MRFGIIFGLHYRRVLADEYAKTKSIETGNSIRLKLGEGEKKEGG